MDEYDLDALIVLEDDIILKLEQDELKYVLYSIKRYSF